MSDPQTIEIQSLGAQGDGIGVATDGSRVFVPNGLPGENWAQGSKGYERVGDSSAERRTPTCPHFDACGGCVAQHMSDALYTGWKHDLIVDALARENLDADVQPLWSVAAETRRRATFEMKRRDARSVIGFHARKGHDVFDMNECRVLTPEIVEALPVIRKIATHILQRSADARVSITKVDSGLTLSIEARKLQRDRPETRAKLAQLVEDASANGLIVNGEILIARSAPVLSIGTASLSIPEKTFLQAVPAAEKRMQMHVCNALKKCKSIADLFCGVGTFAIPLAARTRVAGYDNDVPAINALNHAIRHTQGLKPVTASRRDLFRQPLGTREFKGIDGAVINPPRAGAKAQCEQLAKSTVRTLVMVSCSPTTFARDARILVDGGYEMGAVHPIDQFLWSPHLEVFATFVRR